MSETTTPQPSPMPEYIVLTPKQTKPKRPNGAQLSDVASIIFVFVAAIILALGLITFVFQSYQVDGPSMENTLQNNDRLIVWKVPRTLARITGRQYVPARGEIVVFTESNLAEFGQTDTKQLVKRVIGLPGDRVVVKNGSITIYNKNNPRGFDPDKTLGYASKALLSYTAGDIDLTLSSNQIFVCGDNRMNSLDSRSFGPVSLDSIIGRLALRVYPFDTFKLFN